MSRRTATTATTAAPGPALPDPPLRERLRGAADDAVAAAHAVATAALARATGRSLAADWSFAAELTARLIRREFAIMAGLSPQAARARRERMPVPDPATRRVRWHEERWGGVACLTATPPQARAGAALVFLHGGGYVFGSPHTHRPLLARLALGGGCTVVAPHYRLAPEHPYPAAVDDADAVLSALLDAGQDPRRLAIGGDSAGGGLSAAVLLRRRDAGAPLPAAALLVCPWLDLTNSGATIDAHERYDFTTRDQFERYAAYYAGGADRRQPQLSPLFGNLHGLPPLLIQAGEREMLRADAERFAAAAQDAGVDVRLSMGPGMIHDWQMHATLLPEARAAVDELSEMLRRHTA